ncbi:MAG: RICIN domain-containing protein [Lachnospiraceae bacterium]|nr:RICIN domain-containing protein [Lachnospiraceae bacterium]
MKMYKSKICLSLLVSVIAALTSPATAMPHVSAAELTESDMLETWLNEQEINGFQTLPEDPEFIKLVGQEQEIMLLSSDIGLSGDEYVHNSRFDSCTVRNGIDVSYYQGDIDWSSVKNDGIEFAFIRVGYRGYGSSGALVQDTRAGQNLQNAASAGIKTGVYIFSQAITEAEAREEAEFVLEQIAGYDITMPVVIDYEYVSGGIGRLYNANLSSEQATGIVNAFCEVIEEAGYTPMLYANKSMLENSLNAGDIPYKVWLANYTTETSYQGSYEYWQYSSSGVVSGIDGRVDSDFWYDSDDAEYTQTIENGIYIIESALQEGKVADVNGGSGENCANIQLWSRNDKNSQKFKVIYEGDGKYSIMALCSGKYLDAEDGGATEGTNVIQYEYNNGDNQKWYIKEVSDGLYSIISASSGLYLDVYNNQSDDGTNIQLWTGNGGNSQIFSFLETAADSQTDDSDDSVSARNGWYYENGKSYWYDNGVMACDKEVYDPDTDAWYWFDADGAMATDKDVYIPTGTDRSTGKWVRYDSNGWMIKGEDYRYGGWYWFDTVTGEMKKGFAYIPVDDASEGKWVYYDEINGQMHHGESCIDGNWYYFDDVTGKMVHGEYQRNGSWYYYDVITGIMAHGWTTLPDGSSVYYDDITGIRTD